MARYHLTAKGKLARCRATKRPCPLSGGSYSSLTDAREALESSMGNNFTAVSGQTIAVADEDSIKAMVNGDYRMAHQAPVKDSEGFAQPLHALTNIFPQDVYDHPEWYGLQHPETRKQILQARNNPEAMVKIYRAVPKGVTVIHPGDWVALSEKYSRGESYFTEDPEESGDVICCEVPAKTLYTDANSLEEWGFSGNMTLKARRV